MRVGHAVHDRDQDVDPSSNLLARDGRMLESQAAFRVKAPTAGRLPASTIIIIIITTTTTIITINMFITINTFITIIIIIIYHYYYYHFLGCDIRTHAHAREGLQNKFLEQMGTV